jgi:hypothetical protein
MLSVVKFVDQFFYADAVTLSQLMENVVCEVDVLCWVENNFVKFVAFSLSFKEEIGK